MWRAVRYFSTTASLVSGGSSLKIRLSSSSNIEEWNKSGPCSLCDHQAIDAIGREIFHVAVEQARAFSVQHAVAITNDSANSGARSVFTDAPNFCGRIVETTRLGSHLAILDHGDAVYIERIESPGFIKMDIWNGRRVAPQATAVGKALICQLSREEVQEIAGSMRCVRFRREQS